MHWDNADISSTRKKERLYTLIRGLIMKEMIKLSFAEIKAACMSSSQRALYKRFDYYLTY